MTTTCRSEIVKVLNLSIRTLEQGYEMLVGEDYMDDTTVIYTLDHLKTIRDAISPPFITQDENGDIAISDPVSDQDDRYEHTQELVALLLNRINQIEKKIDHHG